MHCLPCTNILFHQSLHYPKVWASVHVSIASAATEILQIPWVFPSDFCD